MTQKDLDNNANKDHNKNAEQDWENHHSIGDKYPEEAKGIAETEVKNAHAAGDGALERSDKNLSDKNDTELFSSNKKDEKESGQTDPPY